MAKISFYHHDVPSAEDRPGPWLHIESGVDEISWGYRLNTMTYPTYRGEVVQILSCYIDDLEITGTIPSYRKMELIYSYFLYYIQIASQGNEGNEAYNQIPMKMQYDERGWTFDIQPLEAPGFAYGAEIVAPKWRLKAHIVDHSHDADSLKELTKSTVLQRFLDSDSEKFDIEGRIGFEIENPFSAPGTSFGSNFDPELVTEEWKGGDRFDELVASYQAYDLGRMLSVYGSRPAPTAKDDKSSTATKSATAGKK